MLTLVNILILFFTILVIYQIFLAYSGYSIIEGLENDKKYKPYDSNDALILGKQNAGNIIVLENASQMAPSTPPDISGTTTDSTTDSTTN